MADKLGMRSRQTAWAAVHTAIKRSRRKPTEAMRKLELERLDELLLAIYDNACQGNVQAISRVLGIMDRQARLLGLLAPPLRNPRSSSAQLQGRCQPLCSPSPIPKPRTVLRALARSADQASKLWFA